VLVLGASQGSTALLSFVATHDFFAKTTQISDFIYFHQNFRKVGKSAAPMEHPKNKVFQLPQTPTIDSRYHACHGAMPPPPDIAG